MITNEKATNRSKKQIASYVHVYYDGGNITHIATIVIDILKQLSNLTSIIMGIKCSCLGNYDFTTNKNTKNKNRTL